MNPLEWDQKTLRRNAILVLALLSIVLIVHEIFGQNGYLVMRRQAREVQARKAQIQKLTQANQQLEHQVKALKTDPEAIEKLAREQMHMARPGEIIYTLPQKKAPSQDPASAARSSPPKP
jgi:cell division protein FtsB